MEPEQESSRQAGTESIALSQKKTFSNAVGKRHGLTLRHSGQDAAARTLARTSRCGFRGRRRPQVVRAIGTILVALDHCSLALRAGWVQVALAVRAEIVTRADGSSALRAVVGQRLAHQKINDEADREIGWR